MAPLPWTGRPTTSEMSACLQAIRRQATCTWARLLPPGSHLHRIAPARAERDVRFKTAFPRRD
eukprot:750038-Hanusia_phi.AAC.6